MKHYRRFRVAIAIINTACTVAITAVTIYALYILLPQIPIFD